MRHGAGSLPRPVGVPPAVARAFCPCRFTAKMAVPLLAGRASPERSEGMPAPQRARRPRHGGQNVHSAAAQPPALAAALGDNGDLDVVGQPHDAFHQAAAEGQGPFSP